MSKQAYSAMTVSSLTLLSRCLPVWGFSVALIQPNRRILSYESHVLRPLDWNRSDKDHHHIIVPSRRSWRRRSTQSDKRCLQMDRTGSPFHVENRNLLIGLTSFIIISSIAFAFMFVQNDISAPTIDDVSKAIAHFFDNPKSSMEEVVKSVQDMGSLGLLYFGFVYTIAEILAFPAIPLTASAGYLFGVFKGTAIVLASASIAAACSFIIGRTFLRKYVEQALDKYPDFKKIDKAIGKEGFKIMLLLRLSPIFPFALSNYLYGVTSVKFWPYLLGTIFGFLPGTIAYVYTGQIGASLSLSTERSEPWYIYAGGLLIFTIFLKFIADTATGIIRDIEDSIE